MGSITARIIDISKRLIKFDNKLEVIINGIDNAYSERVDRLINNSVTAKSSANIMATYLSGKGWGETDNKILINKSKKLTLSTATIRASKSIARQRGVYIHVNFTANYTIDNFDILPYSHCRLGKADDAKYSGKIGVYDNFTGADGKVNKSKISWLDVFNPEPKVIDAQVSKAGGWDKYKGQIWYINLDDDYIYALSTIDAVMNDCDSEAQSSIFKNRSLRKGFFGKTMIITKPLVGDIQDYGEGQDGAELYRQANNERDAFKKTVDDFLGAENKGGVMHVEMEQDGDSFDTAIKIQNIDSNIEDDIFKYTEESILTTILMAFNNLPIGLVKNDNSLFGNNGESLRVMKETYQENTSQERSILIETFKVLMKLFKDPKEINFVPLIIPKKTETV